MTIPATTTRPGWAGESALLEHVGFVVPSLEAAAEFYRVVLGCSVSARQEQFGQGIAKMYVKLGNLTIELIEPTTAQSPIKHLIGDHDVSEYLRQHPGGGIHHVCFSVSDLPAACAKATDQGYGVLGSDDARISLPGAIVFLDPLTTDGALIELKGRSRC